jgi:hypothetical protein
VRSPAYPYRAGCRFLEEIWIEPDRAQGLGVEAIELVTKRLDIGPWLGKPS